MEPVKVRVKPSSRAKHIRITVQKDLNVVLTVPDRVSREAALKFLEDKKSWIQDKLAYYVQFKDSIDKKDDEAFYLGEVYPLSVSVGPPAVYLGDKLYVSLSKNNKKDLHKSLKKWYVKEARAKITDLVQTYGAAYGYDVNRISIRDQKTRWASCSQRENLNFNYKVIMCPKEVMKYLVIHELTHLTEMNHSKAFWSLVRERCPDYKEHQKWLKQHGAWLRL